MNQARQPFECPVCGADVPAGAKACPGCGADERAGWDEEKTRYDGIDLPYQEDEEVATEVREKTRSTLWTFAALLVAVALAWFFIGGRF